MSRVFFGNSILSSISVNVNFALQGTVLDARPTPRRSSKGGTCIA